MKQKQIVVSADTEFRFTVELQEYLNKGYRIVPETLKIAMAMGASSLRFFGMAVVTLPEDIEE